MGPVSAGVTALVRELAAMSAATWCHVDLIHDGVVGLDRGRYPLGPILPLLPGDVAEGGESGSRRMSAFLVRPDT